MTLKSVKRRNLIRGSLLASGGVAFAACSREANDNSAPTPVTDQPVVQWRMATSWPKSLDILFGGAESICQQVSAMTNGRFTITPYAAEEIVPSFGVLDAVSDGTVECGHSASYYYFEKNPALAFGSTVPFGLNADQQNAWLHYGGGLEAMQGIYKDYGVINFPAGNTGVQMGGWFRKEIESLQDLQGLKMRIPGLGGAVMKRLGVDVKVYSADKIVTALLNGEIDAVEWNNPYDDEIMGLSDAAPYYYYPGWWEPGATYELQINLSQWNQLPTKYQRILKTAAANTNIKMLAHYNASNGEALKRLQAKGISIRPFNPKIIQAAQEKTLEIFAEFQQQDPTFRTVYQSWNQFRQHIYEWHLENEMNYLDFSIQAAEVQR